MRVSKLKKKSLTAIRVYKTQGAINTAILGLQRLQERKIKNKRSAGSKITGKKIFSMVAIQDAESADWTVKKNIKSQTKNSKPPYTINFVMSPPGKGSGGHQNLFRFISYLEKAGHKCNVYLYSTIHFPSISEIKEILKDSYPKTNVNILWLNKNQQINSADAIFATGWETAYPVFNSNAKGKRLYFIQDFEPLFYPMGSEYILAENTYRFGFSGITAGGWLAKKLKKDYGMKTDFFDFGADTNRYKIIDTKKRRKEVFFYARPVTARRGFEIGIMALTIFAKRNPDYTITLAGWDVSDYDLPFKYNNLGTVSLDDLNEVYNKCAVALVMSLTNMSLLPLELLASGTIPVVNEGENNRLVSDNPHIHYTACNPPALAKEIEKIVKMDNLLEYSQEASASVVTNDWDKSGEKFVNLVEKEIESDV